MSSLGKTDGRTRLQCSSHRESGACISSRKVGRAAVEAFLFEGLRDALAQPEAIAEYVPHLQRRAAASSKDTRAGQRLTRRDAEIGRELDRLVDTIAKGADNAPLIPRINALQQERRELQAAIAAAERAGDVIALHPASIERHAADIAALGSIGDSGDPELAAELIEKLRRLVLEVVVHAPPGSDDLAVEIKGRLAELIKSGSFVKRSGRGVIDGSGGSVLVRKADIRLPGIIDLGIWRQSWIDALACP